MRHRWIATALLGVAAFSSRATDIGILTPTKPTLRVTTGWELFEPYTLGITTAAKAGREGELNGWAVRDHFDLTGLLTQHLIASIASSGHSAIAIGVTRKSPDRMRPIAPDELPASHSAKWLLDVTTTYAGIYATTNTQAFHPALLVEYRWLTASGDLIQATQLIIYSRDLADAVRRHGIQGAFWPITRPNAKPYIDADPNCRFASFKDAEQGSAKLWTCFDGAVAKIADQIAGDIPSSESPSGGMTSERDQDRPGR